MLACRPTRGVCAALPDDLVGNNVGASLVYSVDTVPPTYTVAPARTTIDAAEPLTITFSESIDPVSLSLGGSLGLAADTAWQDGAHVGDTLVLTPMTSWPAGSGNVDLTVADLAGNSVNVVFSKDVLDHVVYVAPGGDDTSSGTATAPLATIAGAVARATEVYGYNAETEAHLAGGTYSEAGFAITVPMSIYAATAPTSRVATRRPTSPPSPTIVRRPAARAAHRCRPCRSRNMPANVITVDGCTIQAPGATSACGVWALGAGVTLRNNHIIVNGGSADNIGMRFDNQEPLAAQTAQGNVLSVTGGTASTIGMLVYGDGTIAAGVGMFNFAGNNISLVNPAPVAFGMYLYAQGYNNGADRLAQIGGAASGNTITITGAGQGSQLQGIRTYFGDLSGGSFALFGNTINISGGTATSGGSAVFRCTRTSRWTSKTTPSP